jgi:hypothetical protein
MWRRFSLLVLGLAGTACAAASSTTRPVHSASREVITAAEIVAARVHDVYQAVTQLRPEYLRRRNPAMIRPHRAPEVIVFLDDIEFGTAESMRNIPLSRVRLIRYLTPSEASLRWGGLHPAGVIHVTTLR